MHTPYSCAPVQLQALFPRARALARSVLCTYAIQCPTPATADSSFAGMTTQDGCNSERDIARGAYDVPLLVLCRGPARGADETTEALAQAAIVLKNVHPEDVVLNGPPKLTDQLGLLPGPDW